MQVSGGVMIDKIVTDVIESRSRLTLALASKIPQPDNIDRYMGILVHHLGLLDDQLAQLEADYEDTKIREFMQNKGLSSVNQADQLARYTEGKGAIAKLNRLSRTGWSSVSAAQSKLKRYDHERNINGN